MGVELRLLTNHMFKIGGRILAQVGLSPFVYYVSVYSETEFIVGLAEYETFKM